MYVGVYVLVRFVALFSFCTDDDDDDVEDASSRARFMRCGTDIRVRRVYRISCIVRPGGRASVRRVMKRCITFLILKTRRRNQVRRRWKW